MAGSCCMKYMYYGLLIVAKRIYRHFLVYVSAGNYGYQAFVTVYDALWFLYMMY